MEVVESIVARLFVENVNIDDMQINFMPERGTTEKVILCICRLRKCFLQGTTRCSVMGNA